MGGGRKTADFDVAGFGTGHIGGFENVVGDLITNHTKFQLSAAASSFHRQVNDASFFPAQQTQYVGVLQSNTGDVLLVHLDNAVTGTHPDFFRGTTANGRNYG